MKLKYKVIYFVILTMIYFLLIFQILSRANIITGFSVHNENNSCNSITDCLSNQKGHYYVKNWATFESFKSKPTNYYEPNSTLILHGWASKIKLAKAHFNSDGFRGRDFSINKTNNTFRIMLLGDSFTFGHGLNDNETIGHFLEKNLSTKLSKKIEVLNLGLPGYNSKMEIKRYFSKGIKYKPDLVILFFFSNDYESFDVMENLWVSLKKKYNITGISSGKIQKRDLFPSYYEYLDNDVGIPSLMQNRVIKPYKEFLDYNRKNKINTLFVVFPTEDKIKGILLNFFKKESVEYIFLRDMGYCYKSKWIITSEDIHPSVYATKKVADYLSENIIKQRLLGFKTNDVRRHN